MKYTGILITGIVLLSASPALALGVGTTGTINIDANVSPAATVSASGNASDTSSGSAADTQTNTSGNAAVNADAHLGSVIHITRADVDATTQATTVTSPSSVQSQTDLSAYASGLVKADADMGDAQLSDTAVSLGYTQRAKLFGFIPVFVEATAKVTADGQTEVSYPWYTMFASTDSASLQSDVKASTASTVSATAETNATFSAAEQARLLAQIHDAMKAHLQASLAAEAQTSTSAQ